MQLRVFIVSLFLVGWCCVFLGIYLAERKIRSKIRKIKVDYYSHGKEEGYNEGYSDAYKEIKHGDSAHWEEYE